MKILEMFNLFLVTVQSAKVNLPKYRTPRDGHWTNQMTVKLSINNISYYNISEVLSLLQKYKQKMITYNGDNYRNKFYNMIYLVNKVNIKKTKVK
jgi:hypothetical protein